MRTLTRTRRAPALAALMLACASASAQAQDFGKVTAFLNSFTAFMTGPFGKSVVVISIIAAFCTWVFAPKDGIFGPLLRVVVAGLAIMNAAFWVTQFGGTVTV